MNRENRRVYPTKTPVKTFTTSVGRTFAVRVLPVGARYGRLQALTNENGVSVEFYDTTHADDAQPDVDGFGPLGQFVSRYYLTTLLEPPCSGGLCLDGGVPVWSVDAATMREVRVWLRRVGAELKASPAR